MSHPAIAQEQDKDWLPKTDWIKRHEELLERSQNKQDAELVFLGDSITQGWLGQKFWAEHFEDCSVNLGIGGDETQHVLWRLQHGEVDGLNPLLVILLIGTNNIGNAGHKGTLTAEGVQKILEELEERLPNAKVLMHAVFPRDEKPGTEKRQEVADLNAVISKFADERVTYFDICDVFLNEDGSISPEIMGDYLHLTEEGYRRWTEALLPKIAELIGE